MNNNPLQYGWKPLLWTLMVLALGLSGTAYGLHAVTQNIRAEAASRFMDDVDRIEETIRAQFNLPLYGLRGAIGAQASTAVSRPMQRANFAAYVASRDLPNEFAGIRGFGFIERVMRQDLSRFEAREKADQAPGFAVKTKGHADDLFVVKYLEPATGNAAAVGLDIGSEPVRREAVERAINTGEPSLTGMITLVQDGTQSAGFLYLVPVFSGGKPPNTPPARQAAFTGLFYAPLVVNDLLFRSVFTVNGSVDFELFDGTTSAEHSLVFSSKKTIDVQDTHRQPTDFAAARAFHLIRTMPIGGRLLQLRAGSSTQFEAQINHSTPVLFGAGGAGLSLLLSTITWLGMIGRARAEARAHAMTQDLDRLIQAQKAANDHLAQALRESQTLMAAIDQHALVSIADPTGIISYVNDTFCKVSGYSQDELVGSNHRIVKSDVQSDAFWEHMWNTISSGSVWRNVVCNRAKDGTLYWVDTLVSPFFDHNGIEKYVSIRTDITATKMAEQALDAEREHLSNIITGTDAGTWQWNILTGELCLNERWATMVGYTLSELTPANLQTWTQLCHPEDLSRANLLLERHLNGAIDYFDCDFRMHHRDGHWVWIHARGKTSSRTADGTPEWMSGTHLDISEQKHAEEEMARTTAMLQSVLDAASEVAVITTGLDHTITLFNIGAERMLGYAASDVVGLRPTSLLMDPEEIKARAASLSLAQGRPIPIDTVMIDASTLGKKTEWTLVRKDGSQVMVGMVVTPLSGADGVCTGYLSISHNISTEKAYENWLRTAVEEAEAATIAKSQFLANMSHEIRTPMNAILGMLRLLHTTELSPRQLDYASKTEGAAKSLLGLLNDILDFSKMDARKMELDPQPFRVDRLMRDLSVILSSNLNNKPVEILFDIDPAMPQALIGDSMRLQQVLVNLGGNAIKFTEHGEVIIQLKTLAQTGSHTTLQVAVRDSGIGIAPENQKDIFEGFAQAEASTTRRFGGTGLGLSISKRLVALMGGELALHSELGVGSTFHFTLTLPSAQLPDDSGSSPAPAPTHLSALVVDDNAAALDIMATMTRSLGWQVDTAASGAEAIERVATRARAHQPAYQAIFVDWLMPGMDGWETLSRIEALIPRSAAPILVMVTTQGREMLSRRTPQEQAQLHSFLVKPVTAPMLLDAVANAMAGRSNLRASPRSQAQVPRRLEGIRLLVVDDNLINQQVAQELLGTEGAHVELAANGELGVAAVRGANPAFDAVLMDIQMPVMDGYAATHAIRHELGLPDLPVIAMTANAMASDREACLAAGMNDHVGKPFDLPHLIRVVQHHVDQARGAQRPATNEMPERADDARSTSHASRSADIDVESALERMGGNADLYARVLKTYRDDITTMPDQLEQLIQQGDWGAVRRLLHTVKGLSATVGASHLSAMALAAENTLKNPGSTGQHQALQQGFRKAVAETGAAVDQVARELSRHAAPAPRADLTRAIDRPAVLAKLHVLRNLLKKSDMGALDAHAQLQHACAPEVSGELKGLATAVAAFDFATGVVQCDTLIQKLGVPT